jgi:hypothetical protein
VVADAAFSASAVPQSSQKADEDSFSALHFGQRLDKGLPQAAQNFLPLVLSVPQLLQRIPLPGTGRICLPCITHYGRNIYSRFQRKRRVSSWPSPRPRQIGLSDSADSGVASSQVPAPVESGAPAGETTPPQCNNSSRGLVWSATEKVDKLLSG